MTAKVFAGVVLALLIGVVIALTVTGWLKFTWGPVQHVDRPITDYGDYGQDPEVT